MSWSISQVKQVKQVMPVFEFTSDEAEKDPHC
jgi:hypothetical protein